MNLINEESGRFLLKNGFTNIEISKIGNNDAEEFRKLRLSLPNPWQELTPEQSKFVGENPVCRLWIRKWLDSPLNIYGYGYYSLTLSQKCQILKEELPCLD